MVLRHARKLRLLGQRYLLAEVRGEIGSVVKVYKVQLQKRTDCNHTAVHTKRTDSVEFIANACTVPLGLSFATQSIYKDVYVSHRDARCCFKPRLPCLLKPTLCNTRYNRAQHWFCSLFLSLSCINNRLLFYKIPQQVKKTPSRLNVLGEQMVLSNILNGNNLYLLFNLSSSY